MTEPGYRLAAFDAAFDVSGFDCGEPEYNIWLTRSAARANESGSARVYALLEKNGDAERVVGYFAICPTLVVRETMPKPIRRGMLASTPGWLLAKLALDTSLRGHRQQWGRLLLREALETIMAAVDRGGGQVIVVDPDNAALVPFYERNGFQHTGGPDLRMFVKVATVRAHLAGPHPH